MFRHIDKSKVKGERERFAEILAEYHHRRERTKNTPQRTKVDEFWHSCKLIESLILLDLRIPFYKDVSIHRLHYISCLDFDIDSSCIRFPLIHYIYHALIDSKPEVQKRFSEIWIEEICKVKEEIDQSFCAWSKIPNIIKNKRLEEEKQEEEQEEEEQQHKLTLDVDFEPLWKLSSDTEEIVKQGMIFLLNALVLGFKASLLV